MNNTSPMYLNPPKYLAEKNLIPINFEIGNTYRKVANPSKSNDGTVNQHGWTCFVRLENDYIKYTAYIIKSINFRFDIKKETFQK